MNKGFTLIEVLVAIAIFSVLMLVATDLLVSIFQKPQAQLATMENIDRARSVVSKFTNEIRAATSLIQTGDSQIIFYSPIGATAGSINKIRYYVSNNTLYKGVTAPVNGNYGPPAVEVVNSVLTDVENGAVPLFSYYDGSLGSGGFPVSGLQSYWNLDESSGNIAHDSLSQSNSGTWQGSGQWVAGKINNSANFIQAQPNTLVFFNPSLGSDFSISLWIMPSQDLKTVSQGIFESGTQAKSVRIYSNSDNKLHFELKGDASAGVSINNWAGQWHHLVLANSNSNLTLYIDGVSAGTASGFGAISDSFTLGIADGKYFDGRIDEVGIWNRALTGSEIISLYNGGAGLQYGNWQGWEGNPISQPVAAAEVKYIKINLIVGYKLDQRSATSLFTLSAGAAIRSFKDNGGI